MQIRQRIRVDASLALLVRISLAAMVRPRQKIDEPKSGGGNRAAVRRFADAGGNEQSSRCRGDVSGPALFKNVPEKQSENFLPQLSSPLNDMNFKGLDRIRPH
jgi:hypothetical protein